MSKSFFVIVPYNQVSVSIAKSGGGGPLAGLFGGKKNQKADTASFEEQRSQLEQRIDVVQSGLARTGVRAAQLGTEEVIELFYKMFNIGELDRPMAFGQEVSQQ